MDGDPQPRVTIALAIGAIVAVVAMFLTGAVAGQPPAAVRSVIMAEDGPAAHAHDDELVSDPTTSTTAHAHDEETAAAEVPEGDEPAAVHAHGDVENAIAIAVPVADATDHAHATDAAPADPVTTPTTVHDHSTMPTTTTVPDATTDTTVVDGPIISLDDPRLTEEQRAAARTLLAGTRAAMASFPDEQAVIDAGYVSIGDGVTGFEHYVNVGYLTDGAELDPTRIESIVLQVSGGTKTVASAMYILTTGSTMAEVPEIAGELTTWHDHQNLCWEGTQVVAITRADGTCPRGEFRPTAPMLHVWLTDQPCGPFSGIEGIHGGGCHNL